MVEAINKAYYEKALLIRRTEDTFLDLFNQGSLNGTVHTCSGQEFSAIAFASNLETEDFIFSSHRCHGHYLAKTNDLKGLISELMGKESGTCAGIGSSQHLCHKNFYSNGVQGGIVPVAAGMALAKKKEKQNLIGVVFIGDGTLGEGVVYETFNLASLFSLPLLIVCENNRYAQSTRIEDNLSGDILTRAKSFGIKTFHSNTWDLQDLFSDSDNSIRFVREEGKPAFHLVDTYRLNHHSKSDDNRDVKEVAKFYKMDPLNIYEKSNPKLFKSMLEKVNKKINKVIEDTRKEQEISGESYVGQVEKKEDYEYFPLNNINERVVSRINLFFKEVMAEDKKVLFIGEDILSPYGGAFKVANNLSTNFPESVISTPISEQSIVGLSNGLALSGFRPFIEIMFGDFMALCFDQIVNHASKFHHMYNRKVNCPVVIRTPMGGGRGYGPTHSQTLDKFLVGIDNVTVIAINSFIDPKEIYESVYKNEKHPTIVIENKLDYARFVGSKSNDSYLLEKSSSIYPLVRCLPKHEEPDLTIVTYGGIASDLFQQLDEIFIQTELISEVLILSKIAPLDMKPIFDSVKKTKRLIVIEEGSKEFGVGAEIISRVSEELSDIKLFKRIGAHSVPIPSSRKAEEHVLPNTRIAKAISDQLQNDSYL